MSTRVKRVFGFLVLSAAFIAITGQLAPPASNASGPYFSALSDLTAGALLAAAPCDHKVCFVNRHTGQVGCMKVAKNDFRNCTLTSPTTCSTTPC